MELKRLSHRQLEVPTTVLVLDLVHSKPLLRRTHPTRHPNPNSERIRQLHTLCQPLIPNIPSFLLVNTSEFRQLRVELCESSEGGVVETFDRR